MVAKTEVVSNHFLNKELDEKINSISQYQRPFIKKGLLRLAHDSSENAKIVCNYITAEQTELNIKESTKEGKIKCLIWLSNFLEHKSFHLMTKQDLLNYLNHLRKAESLDPKHKWIGSYNSRQMIFLKFFRWLYNQDESDSRKRITPPCMQGIKHLPRKEKSPYKPDDLWTEEEHALFLKYCPSKRDSAFHAMANDTSARPHELLNLKIKDIIFKRAEDGIQYAEVLVCGKTNSRSLPLIYSIPYVKDWLQVHPLKDNPEAWLFVSFSKWNKLGQLTRDGLLKKYAQYYRDRYFRGLIINPSVPDRDKAYLKNLFTKPWNLYIFRHSALTQKSQILKEHMLRNHAGWSPTSKMPEIYLHYFGTESSTSLLEAHGIIKKDKTKKHLLTPLMCPNCNNSNRPEERFCIFCKMVLKYEAYNKTIEDQNKRDSDLVRLNQQFKEKERQIELMKIKHDEDVSLLKDAVADLQQLLRNPKKLFDVIS